MPGWVSKSVDGYTLERIHEVMGDLDRPHDFSGPGSMGAFDVFAGYLVLDAILANQDRHARNWAVVRGPNPRLMLMASFDHGSSLGFRITDTERARRLAEPGGVRRWCERGRATTFEGTPGLVELAGSALNVVSAEAAAFWIARVRQLRPDQLHEIARRIPQLSDVTATFVSEVMVTNRERLLDA